MDVVWSSTLAASELFNVEHIFSSSFLVFISSFEVVNRKHVCFGGTAADVRLSCVS